MAHVRAVQHVVSKYLSSTADMGLQYNHSPEVNHAYPVGCGQTLATLPTTVGPRPVRGPRMPRTPTEPHGIARTPADPTKKTKKNRQKLANSCKLPTMAHGCSGPGLVALQGGRQHRGPPQTPRTPTDPRGQGAPNRFPPFFNWHPGLERRRKRRLKTSWPWLSSKNG
jgi:hypothetical protein